MEFNKEMSTLKLMADKAGYDYFVKEIFETPQLIFMRNGQRVGDVISHRYSFGGVDGLLEIMGCGIKDNDGEDDVMGNLTTEECFDIIRKYYESQRNLTLLILYKETYCAMIYSMKT